jgi:hypothetical protein
MILSMTFKNFRGHRDKTVHFGPGLNVIKGPNEIGKTSINEGISFGFFGTDSAGSKNPDHLISTGEEVGGVIITTDKASFERIKRRGQTATVNLIRNGVPPIKLNQTELTALLGISFEVFASCYNEGFFMDTLSQAKRLEVIGQVAKVDRKALLSSLVSGMTLHPKIKFENLRVDAQVIATERRIAQNQLAADQGALAQIETQLSDFKGDLASMDLDGARLEIEQLTAQVDLFDLYTSELSKYQTAMTKARENHEDNLKLDGEKKKIETELKSLGTTSQTRVTDLEAQNSSLETEKTRLLSEMETVPPAPTFTEMPEGSCPKCGQLVPPKLRETAARAREKAINEYNQKAREIQDRNQGRSERIRICENSIRELFQQISSHRTLSAVNDSKRRILQERLTSLQPKEVRKPTPPPKPEGDEQALRTKLSDLRAKFHAHQLFQQKKEQLVAREKMYKTAIEQKLKLTEELKKFEAALLKMPELEVKQTLEMLKTPGVLFSFVDEEFLVTDERLVPYTSLSRGRRKKIGLELCKTFQRLVAKAPQFYFIDDVELMDEYASRLPRAQVLIAKVDNSVTELQVIQS